MRLILLLAIAVCGGIALTATPTIAGIVPPPDHSLQPAQFAKVVCAAEANSADSLLQSCGWRSHRIVPTADLHHSSLLDAVAWGKWSDSINSTGWASVSVSTNRSFSSLDQLYAAGYLEGGFTHTRIAQHFTNLFQMQMEGLPDDAYTQSMDFIVAQQQWTMQQIAANPTDPIFQAANLTLTQLAGLADGYSAARNPNSEQPLALIDFLYFQSANDDMTEVMGSLFIANQTNCWDTTEDMASAALRRSSHCSALVKPIRSRDGHSYSDLLVAHNSWFDYRVMLRVMKSYHFPLQADFPAVADYSVLFSSYPGYVWSMDDYYQTHTVDAASRSERSLYVMETTNNVCNVTLLNLITPLALFTWQRTVIANMLATGGETWTAIFAKHNSGTYNNQMQIVDFTRFHVGSDKLEDGLFWIIEQMPGATYAADVTHHLREHEYWASYNVPYFNEVWVGLGYAASYAVFGDQFSHDHCPRANIFRRDHVNARDMESLKLLMRENNWQTDPLSLGSPYYAIAARGDLMPGGTGIDWVNKSTVGCVDAKCTNVDGMKYMHCDAIAGPTTEKQPPFDWSSDPVFEAHSHVGQPELWNFATWQKFKA